MSLPIFQTQDKNFQLMQTGWSQQLNPVILNPLSQSVLLVGIKLKNGTTVINHTLGRKMQGWIITDINLQAQVFRTGSFNDLTLSLVCNADATVNLVVF